MEGREGVSSSSGEVPVVGSDAPSDYHVAPRSDNPIQTTEPSPTLAAAPSPVVLAEPAAGAIVLLKKKRGRPRKYAPDGSLNLPLSPKPISSSVIDFSAQKRGKVRPVGAVSRPKFEVENLGEWIPCSSGTNFTPHIITVNIGEDVTMKVISFLQQGPRAICILSANGAISSVTLRQPDSSGGTLTYEGRFEILSLSGSFMPSETRGTRSRSGGMSVSLASPDGRVVGGGVAGLLVAATPVQVIVGSFLSGNQHEERPKKPKNDVISTASPEAIVPVSTSPPSYVGGDNWPSLATSKSTDINVSFFNGEDDT